MRRTRFLLFLQVLLLCSCSRADVRFSVQYPASAFPGPFSGRVVVYLSQGGPEPRFGPDWFNPQPEYSATFTNIAPGAPMVLDNANTVGFPGRLSAIPLGEYQIQAVIDRDLGGRSIGSSPGNLYSAVRDVKIDPSSDSKITLECDNVVPEPTFRETAQVKQFKLQPKLLTAFYHRPTYIKGAVVLPDAYLTNPSRKFPILYEIPGFGGSSDQLSGFDDRAGIQRATMRAGRPFLYVMLDPNVPTGHCVFADSANNGPWGQALTTEYIPALESKFRAIGQTEDRLVTGHSSGGWSSLWLQISYPDVFGGLWSTSPDPVDFHLFQLVDIYAQGANMFYDRNGKPIPLAREGNVPAIFTKKFSDMERPIRGEQLGSFEAVFSPKGLDGQPEKLWNRDTGAIDAEVADAWKKYDIARILKQSWATLGPELKGKLHIFCGTEDTFYLDGAVKLLKKELAALGSDAEVEMVPGDHFTMLTSELQQKMDREMAETVNGKS